MCSSCSRRTIRLQLLWAIGASSAGFEGDSLQKGARLSSSLIKRKGRPERGLHYPLRSHSLKAVRNSHQRYPLRAEPAIVQLEQSARRDQKSFIWIHFKAEPGIIDRV